MDMHEIKTNEISLDFEKCWTAARKHLIATSEGENCRFIRNSLTPILLDHFSFALGNQIFFIHVNDAESQIAPPSTIDGCIYASEMGKGIPCILTMRKISGEHWIPANSGWGLRHATTGELVHPKNFLTNDDIEISDWELQDIGLRRIVEVIEKSGGTIVSFNSDPTVKPSLYFEDEHNTLHFVVLSTSRYPFAPELSEDITTEIKRRTGDLTSSGFKAEITLVSTDDPFDSNAKHNGNYLPLIRGKGYHQKFTGLIPLP